MEQHSDLSSRRSNKESRLKKPLKVAKKNLNAAFTSVSDVFPPEITEKLAEFSPISEISENFAPAGDPHPPLVASSEPLTPASTITANKTECDLSPDNFESNNRSEGSKLGSVEVDVLANLLKQARYQVSNSNGVNIRSKKLLDALIKLVLDEFHEMPEEKDRFTELLEKKTAIKLKCFLIWILVVSVIFFFNSGSGRSVDGPLLT